MSVQGGVEEMKSGRVVVTPEVEPMSDIWFYQDGFIKNKVRQAPVAFIHHRPSTKLAAIILNSTGFIASSLQLASNMSLQVMGNIEPAAKVVLWTESRQPIQTWMAQMRGLITSLTFPGMVLDVKGTAAHVFSHS